MLITLSSKNEIDNSHFINFFQDTIVLPPQSRVSLVSSSIVVSNSAVELSISLGETMDIMFDCWNIFTIPLQDGEYSVADWIVLQNAKSEMTSSNPIWYVEFETNDNILSLLFKRHAGPIVGGSPSYLLVWHAEFAALAYQNGSPMTTNMILRDTSLNLLPITYPTALSVGTNNSVSAIKNNTGAAYGTVSHFNTSTLNWDYASGGNKFDFNRWMGEFIAQLGAACTTQMHLCDNDFNTATNLYTTNENDYTMKLDFGAIPGSGKFNVHRKDYTGTDVIVAENQLYRPGDFIYIKTEGSPTVTGTEYCIGQHVRKLTEPNGLQLWIPMDLTENVAASWNYNSGQGNSGSAAELVNGTSILQSINSNSSDALAKAYYDLVGLGVSKTGWRSGGGDPTNFIKDVYVGTDVEGLTRDSTSQMPDNGAIFYRRVDEQRLRLFDNGTQLVGPNESIDTALPSLVMLTFKLIADADSSHILLGGSNEVLRIETGSAPNNIQYYDSAGTLYQTSFGGHQIIAGDWYTFGIATFGNLLIGGDPQIRILLMESDGTFHFTDTPTITTKPKNLRGINTIAGIFGSGGASVQYSNSTICDFRYYQKNEYSTITGTTYWDSIFQNIANFSVNTANAAVAKPKQWFGVLETENVWTPSEVLDYNMAPPASGSKEMYQWFLDRPAGANPNGDWFDHNMLNATSQDNYISGVQQKVVGLESANALDIEGVALINVGKTEIMSVLNLVAPGVDYESKIVRDADPTNLGIIEEIVGKTEINLNELELVHNININNLPNNALDGNRKQISKTIYQMPAVCDERETGVLRHKSFTPPSRVYLELKNSDEIILNQLEVQITKEDGTSDNRIEGTSNIVIEIN